MKMVSSRMLGAPKMAVLLVATTTMLLSTASALGSSTTTAIGSWASFLPFPTQKKAGKDRRSRRRTAASVQRKLEFGDYAQIPGPDTCPFTTSCPVVCVANSTDCPTTCEEGLELCVTGNCQPSCEEYESQYVVENPCECESLPLACPKVVDVYPTCLESFEDFYKVYEDCIEAQEDATPLVNENGPWFVACWAIFGSTCVLVVLWCCFNTYTNVPGCTARFIPGPTDASSSKEDNSREEWTFTGYRYHFLGLLVNALVICVLMGIQVVLLVLTIYYYLQQEADGMPPRWTAVYQDEVQVLKVFEIVWMIGFVFAFAFKYPTSIRDLFLRRCPLEVASFVHVMAPMKQLDVNKQDNMTRKRRCGERLMKLLWTPIDWCLRMIFSMPKVPPNYETVVCPVKTDQATGKRAFYFRMRRFVYDTSGDDEHERSFQPGVVYVGTTLGDFLNQSAGLDSATVEQRVGQAGPNFIPVTKPTVLGCIFREFSKPFYVYQNYMVWTWAPYWYYYMAITNTIVRVTGGVVVAIFQYLSDSDLFRLSHIEGQSTVLRDGKYLKISNRDIVPGDVVVLKPGVVACDMVVLKAASLVVDESALTGEANPVVKTEIDSSLASSPYDAHRHKSSTLSAGTEILETGEELGKDLGLVLATGSFTTKGKLVTDVLSYQRHKFKFDDEVKAVLFILIVEAVFMVAMVFAFIGEEDWVYAWFYAVFVLGTVIPPLLPTVFVVSVGISARRLQANRITCTYQEGILVAGKVNAAFFDKTGTLTKQGVDFISLAAETPDLSETSKIGMSVCHTLHKTNDGALIGNHVDVVAFRYSGAELIQKDGSPTEVKMGSHMLQILKQFEFDSHLQRSSVVVRDASTGKTRVFVKGSPEAIHKICVSGVPSNFDETLSNNSASGIYCLAIAFKDFVIGENVGDIKREDVESSVEFGAFLNFRNSMREETPGVLKELADGNVTSTMITGDSVLTGIYIAKESGLIRQNRQVWLAQKNAEGEIKWTLGDGGTHVNKPTENYLNAPSSDVDLAMTGETWTTLLRDDPKFATIIGKHVRVFGRCNPSDKVAVVSHFVEQGYKTLMCGDGGNDCGALSAGHVGIALSTADASVVAPFTSLDKDITSVSQVLREGRCALASAFAAYSYYIMYGQVESIMQVINAYFAITFSEWQWVFLDGIWSTLLAFSLPLAKSAGKLSPKRPTASLLGPRTMFSINGMLLINFLFIVFGLVALFAQDWFQCRKWETDDIGDILGITDNYETEVLFIIGGWQYISSAVALNFGYTWRQTWARNYVFVALAFAFAIMHFVATLVPSSFSCFWRVNCYNEVAVREITTTYPVAILNPWNTIVMPLPFRWILAILNVANLLLLCIWQKVVVNGCLSDMLLARRQRKQPSGAPGPESPGIRNRPSNAPNAYLASKELQLSDDKEKYNEPSIAC